MTPDALPIGSIVRCDYYGRGIIIDAEIARIAKGSVGAAESARISALAKGECQTSSSCMWKTSSSVCLTKHTPAPTAGPTVSRTRASPRSWRPRRAPPAHARSRTRRRANQGRRTRFSCANSRATSTTISTCVARRWERAVSERSSPCLTIPALC